MRLSKKKKKKGEYHIQESKDEMGFFQGDINRASCSESRGL